LKQYSDNSLNRDRDKWIDIAFPVTVAAIVSAIIIPSLFVQMAGKFHIIIDNFSKVAVSVVSVQLFFIVPLLFVAILTSGKVRLRDKLGLINWEKKYWIEACYYELILFFPLLIIAAVMFFVVAYFGLDTSSPITTLLLAA